MTTPFRLRFAPSPTGYLHLGSARAALFNWLQARHLAATGHDAEFFLRIEDTDLERSQPELIQVIFDVLAWLGIDHDGDPVYQSQRAPMHEAAIELLLAEGTAYRCDCTQDDVKARNEANGTTGYDGFCRDRGVGGDVTHVVRFRSPDEGATSWDDLIRGEITVEHRTIEDFVLRRSDGSPVFLVANAVDDGDMGITHVIRGEDLINVTPKVILLRAALGYEGVPRFAHMPLIVNEQRKKLSKRRDDVSVEDYKARGVLPEAMVNYLALLGWGPPDDVEVRPLAEIVELFDIADVGPSPAMFDVAKLEAINGEYIRMLSVNEFVKRSLPFFEDQPWYDAGRRSIVEAMAPDLQKRARLLSEVPGQIDFLFLSDPEIDDAAWTKAAGGVEDVGAWLDAVSTAYDEVGEWTAEELHRVTSELAERYELKLGKAQAPIRVAVTGRTVGPPLFEALAVLGRDETLRRIAAVRGRVG